MTKSKRVFADMLVEIQGFGDPEEIAKTMTLVDIIYELKKAEDKASAAPEDPEVPELQIKIRDFWSWLSSD